MKKEELFESVDYNTTTLSHSRALKKAINEYLKVNFGAEQEKAVFKCK